MRSRVKGSKAVSGISKATVEDIVGDEINISKSERGGTPVVVVKSSANLWFDKDSAAALGALITRIASELPARSAAKGT